MQYLKQSTASTIMLGPFVDKADGITLKTDATTITDIDHATTGIFLSKAGGTAAVRHQGVTASVADAYGMMKVTLDTTDTNTVGTLDVLFAKAATYLPVHKCFQVVAANVYDSNFGSGSVYQKVDLTQILTVAVSSPATAGILDVNVKNMNNVAATSITAINANQGTTQPVNFTGTGATAYVKGDAVDIGGTAAASATIGTVTTATTTTTLTNLPAVTTDWLTGAGVKADAVTKIQNGLATPTNITAGTITTTTNLTNLPAAAATAAELAKVPKSDSTVSWNATALGAITTACTASTPTAAGLTNPNAAEKSVVDAIKVQTDKMAFTVANEIDCNPLRINGDATVVQTIATVFDTTTTANAYINDNVTAALNTYDPPTKAELDAAQANVSVDEIQASALADLFNTDSGTTYAAAVSGSPVKEIADNAGGAALTEAGIADAVWNEDITTHSAADSAGEALQSASSAGDPWNTALPGAYTAGKAGYIIGTNLDAKVSDADNSTAISGLNDISVADIIAGVADGSYDLQEMLRLITAVCVGKSSGGGTSTIKFRDTADSKDRITATVDADGNRTAITMDAS